MWQSSALRVDVSSGLHMSWSRPGSIAGSNAQQCQNSDCSHHEYLLKEPQEAKKKQLRKGGGMWASPFSSHCLD